MSKEIHFITYPRCGSTYLSALFKYTFLKEAYKTHFYNTTINESVKNKEYYRNAGTESFKKEHYIITVLRDPIDAISSLTAMEHFYNEDKDNNLDFNITRNKEYYILFFTTIPKFADLMLNFEDINKNKDKIIKHVSTETDNVIFYNNFEPNFSDAKERNFLKSSKTYDQYEYIKEKIVDSDLSRCYEIYNILINECKKF